MSLPERIAHLALSIFDDLPSKCKPRTQSDGRREWTPMAAIVLAVGDSSNADLKCVSLATGTKCLPASTIPKCNGLILHDSHAEILCLRGLNRWLLNEVKCLIKDPTYISSAVEARTQLASKDPPFVIRDGVEVYMFCTVAPCGDASMELLMAKTGDAVPWEVDPAATTAPLGRGYFSILGAVRRKPARADADVTMSKSCSDKLAVAQFVGVLGFPLDLLVGGRVLSLKGLVVYADQYDRGGYERAFGRGGRLGYITGVEGRFFDVHVLPEEFPRFEFERVVDDDDDGKSGKATNVCAVYVAASGVKGSVPVHEVLVNGVKQGYKQLEDRTGKGSALCRRKMVESVVEAWKLLGGRGFQVPDIDGMRYNTLKSLEGHRQKRERRNSMFKLLGAWTSNSAEDDFQL